MGVKEMVQKILKNYPEAIRDVDQDGKNVVLLAVENRQPAVLKLLIRESFGGKVCAFQQVDRNGNSVLHLAATCKPWLIPGAALQMQSEIKWYQFVKKSLPTQSVRRLNKKGQTDMAVFNETHKDLVRAGGDWLNNTSESCSVVAALIATVAFATVAAIPGTDKHATGNQTSEDKPALEVFSVASLIALCFSVASLVTFLAVLTSGYEEPGFYARLTAKLIFGLTSLFISMASMLTSFLACLSFVFKYQLNIQVLTVYTIAILPIAFSAVTLFPLYEYLIRSAFCKRPPRTYLSETSLISSME